MMQLLNKKRKLIGNKGFSLVELIIVIAIMAVLVAILAPQYLKYVEKSRVSADNTTKDGIVNSVKIAISDPDIYPLLQDGDTVTWTYASGVITVTSGLGNTTLEDELENTLGSLTQEVKSNKYKALTQYLIRINLPATGSASITETES